MEDKTKNIIDEPFLNYTGEYEEINENEKDKEEEDKVFFKFKFGDKMKGMDFLEIIPPVYDVSFKTIFSYDKEGLEITKDFLNSVLFPKTELIEEITSFTSVDDAFIAKVKNKNKAIIVDLEMEKYFKNSLIEKFHNQKNGLRKANEFMEIWVISFCLNKSKKPMEDKNSKSYILKKNKVDEFKILDYIHIYEICLNDLYNNLDKDIELFEGEVIKEKGKEWIKLLTITLWSKHYKSKIYYLLPCNLSFKGENIKKAIRKLSDIKDLYKIRLETEIRSQKEDEEINNRIIKEKYIEGYKKGVSDGYIRRKNEGYQSGQEFGYKLGYDKGFKKGAKDGYNKGIVDGFNNSKEFVQLKLLDFFFQQFLNGKSVENIEIIGIISYDKIKNRYINYNNQVQQQFFGLLYSKNLLIQ